MTYEEWRNWTFFKVNWESYKDTSSATEECMCGLVFNMSMITFMTNPERRKQVAEEFKKLTGGICLSEQIGLFDGNLEFEWPDGDEKSDVSGYEFRLVREYDELLRKMREHRIENGGTLRYLQGADGERIRFTDFVEWADSCNLPLPEGFPRPGAPVEQPVSEALSKGERKTVTRMVRAMERLSFIDEATFEGKDLLGYLRELIQGKYGDSIPKHSDFRRAMELNGLPISEKTISKYFKKLGV